MPGDLHLLDAVVVAIYLLGITALGVWMARRISTMSDYFMPRRFGKVMMVTHAFGTGTASDQAVSVAAETFRSGISGIWWQWVWLPVTPFYWLIAPIMRRFRAVTTADVLTLRYDRSVAVLFAVVGIVGLSVKTGLLLEGSSALVDSCTGGWIDANWAIAIMTGLLLIYGTAGGLGAAIVTDFVQGILTVIFSFLLLPFVLNAVGGLQGIRQTVQDPQMMSLVVPGEIGIFFVVMYSLQALIGIVAQPFILGVCSAGRREIDNRVGFMAGNILKRVCTAAWSLTALGVLAWYLQRGGEVADIKPDSVYGLAARAFLPGVLPGLLGLFLASLLASVMSSCDSYMVSSAGLFTGNIYKPLVRGMSNHHYVTVGRISGLAVVLGGVVFTFWVPDVVTALKIWFKIAPMMGIAFWMGLLWRRGTVLGAWAATLTGFGAWFLTTTSTCIGLVQSLPFAEPLRLIWQKDGSAPEIYEPWKILFYTLAAILAGIGISLLTRPVAKEKLDRFYALTRTPIAGDEATAEPCTLPPGVEAPPRRMLVTAGGLEIPMPSRTSVVGFAAGWMAVVALIGGFLLLLSSP